jgi:AcrR family transcriptional regulator
MTKDQEHDEKQNTRCRIIDAGIRLFGLKGFAATTTREICKLANVNIASLNYHFRSKENLLSEVNFQIMCEFKEQVNQTSTENVQDTKQYAEKIFRMFAEDGPKFLNHFKIFIEAENYPIKEDRIPPGHEKMNLFLKQELNAQVPDEELVWANSMIFGYLIHMALMVSSPAGREAIAATYPNQKEDVVKNMNKLIDMIVRDLNSRFT